MKLNVHIAFFPYFDFYRWKYEAVVVRVILDIIIDKYCPGTSPDTLLNSNHVGFGNVSAELNLKDLRNQTPSLNSTGLVFLWETFY